QASQALRPARTWHGTNIDFRLTKLSVISCDDHVTSHGELTATTKGKTRNCGDNGFPNHRQLRPRSKAIFDNLINWHMFDHLGDIGTCSKSAFISGENNDANFMIVFKFKKSFNELVHKLS